MKKGREAMRQNIFYKLVQVGREREKQTNEATSTNWKKKAKIETKKKNPKPCHEVVVLGVCWCW